MAGYSSTPLAKKLGIKDGHKVGWSGGPGGFRAALALGPAVVVDHGFAGARSYDVIIVFNPDRACLESAVDRFPRLVKPDGGLWLAWPKLSGRLATSDIKEADVRRAGLDAGMVDNKVCAIDADWSGLRFVYRKADRERLGAGRAHSA